MRGSLFVANPWARQPMRPLASVQLGQTMECDGNVCRITRPPVQPEPTPVTPPPPTADAPTITAPAPSASEESSFPVVPVVAGVGAIALAALLLG